VIDQVSQAGVASTKWTYLFSSLTVTMSAFSVEEWGIILGVLLGFLTFAVNFYFKSRILKIELKAAEQKAIYYGRREGDDK